MPHSPKQTAVSLLVESNYYKSTEDITVKRSSECKYPKDWFLEPHTRNMEEGTPHIKENLHSSSKIKLFWAHYNTDLIGNLTGRTEELKPASQFGNDEKISCFYSPEWLPGCPGWVSVSEAKHVSTPVDRLQML